MPHLGRHDHVICPGAEHLLTIHCRPTISRDILVWLPDAAGAVLLLYASAHAWDQCYNLQHNPVLPDLIRPAHIITHLLKQSRMAVDGFWDAWPSSPPSLYGDEPLSNQMGPRGKVTTFVNAQGLRLASYYWPAEQPRAVLQHNHGNGSYVMELLKSQVRSLAPSGYAASRLTPQPAMASRREL